MKYGISMEESMDAVWNKYGRKYGISMEYVWNKYGIVWKFFCVIFDSGAQLKKCFRRHYFIWFKF